MIAETKPLAAISQEAIRLLYRELGIVNTVRFLRQFTAGFGNYTEERKALFGDKDMDKMVSEIVAIRKPS
jgi:hypothetical protein